MISKSSVTHKRFSHRPFPLFPGLSVISFFTKQTPAKAEQERGGATAIPYNLLLLSLLMVPELSGLLLFVIVAFRPLVNDEYADKCDCE